MNLHDAPFRAIKSERKTVEMRLFDEKRKLLKTNDLILFTNIVTNECLSAKIKEISVFESFEELYKHYNKISIGYEEDEEAQPDDMLLYYTKEQIKAHGVVAITIELCK